MQVNVANKSVVVDLMFQTVYGAVYIADVCRSQSTNLPLLQNVS